uniref:Amiloride-sensitive sodium channel n=1 Tax=Macrostomum lignano TaxID=282301 RepID=A0A1I8HZV3_9PLAT
RLRTVTGAAQEVAGITRTHGLLHIFLSRGTARRLFWLLLFVAALIGCTVHLAKLVQKFTEQSVESQLKLGSERAQFPDVTICNFKPASASLIRWNIYHDYLNKSWGNFDNWFQEDTKKRPQESDESYEDRLETVCKKLLDVMWVSGDTRDISHLDKTMLLSCRYNSEPCSHRNFSLVQTSRFWSCYTFHPDPGQSSSGSGGRGAELDMVLFTDETEFVDVASATSTSIKLRPIHNRLKSTPSRRCSEPPIETINYVRHFSNASLNVVTKAYSKSVSDFVVEAQQSILHSNCGCYSHLLPFSVNTSDLCYFAPPQEWITPSDAVLKRIDCHDHWFEHAQRQSDELAKEFQHRMWCQFTQQRPWQQSRRWPPFSAIQEIWENLMVPQVRHGVEFLPEDGKEHHIFRNMNQSRQYSQILPFLNDDDCMSFFCNHSHKDYYYCDTLLIQLYLKQASGCIERYTLSRSLASVSVSLQSPAADVYKEKAGYHWTEALSEVGGTLGLWLGISVVSTFELLEFFYILAQRCRGGTTGSESEGSPD